MSTLTDVIFDLTNSVPFVDAVVKAYLASDQGLTLYQPDGSPISPIGSVQATTETDSTGVFTLSNLTENTVYDLWVQPTDQPPFWLPYRLPDVTNTVAPCVLFGALVDPKETDIIWAFLEEPCITPDGLHINQGITFSVISKTGTFSLKLWPTLSLTPKALYRITIGKSTYRGSVPSQGNIKLADWIALPSTQILASL